MSMNALTLCQLAYSSPPLTAKPDYPEILQSYCSEIMIILLWINFTINNLNAFLRHTPTVCARLKQLFVTINFMFQGIWIILKGLYLLVQN